jgi:hypothetical protein
MPTPCATCSFSRHLEIDDLLRARRSARSIAEMFAPLGGPSRFSVDRHLANGHVPGMPANTIEVLEDPRPAPEPASPVEVMREALDALRAMDPAHLSPAVLVARIDAIRRTAEAIGKQEPAPRAEVMSVDDFLDAEGGLMRRLIASMFIRLEPYPGVRAQVLADIQELGLDQQQEVTG